MTFYGSAVDNMSDVDLYVGPSKWKNSYNSFKIEIYSIHDTHVGYYSYYISADGYEFILGTMKVVSVNDFVKRVKKFELIPA